MAAEHWIGRLRFEVAAPDDRALEPVRHALRHRLEALVLPRLQAALDGVDPGGPALHFGRLEVELGEMTAAEAGSELLARRIGEGLRAAMRMGRGAGEAGGVDVAPELRREALLEAFLLTGTLPWPEPGRALGALVETLAGLGEAEFLHVADRLRRVLARAPASERLVRQLPAAIVRRFALALAPAATRELVASGLPGPAKEGFVGEAEVAVWTTILEAAARGDSVPGGRPRQGRSARASTRETAAEVRAPAPRRSARSRPRPGPAPEAEASPSPAGSTEEVPLPAPELAAAALPVAAAGTVLLHPFLATFFRLVGLLDEDGLFRDAHARRRAVLLTHYLATGLPDAAEPDTLMAKLLCGLDFGAPVPRRIELEAVEGEQAEALLATVIGHWKKLGGASPAALRETFLTRPGRLERQAEGWKLRVEARGVDILLDSLPWAISVVKTPFMAETLRVDWR